MAKSIYIQEGLLYINQRAIPSQSFEVVFSNSNNNVSIFYTNGKSKMLENELITGIASNLLQSTFYTDRSSIEEVLKVFITGNPKTVDVAIQDQTTPDISMFMAQELDTFSLSVNSSTEDSLFNITTTGTVPVTGNYIMMQEGNSFYQSEIIGVTPVAGNEYAINVAMPLDFPFTTSVNGYLQNVNLSLLGSIEAPVKFALSPKGMTDEVEWDITRMVISATMASSGDEGLFANITKLVNGLFFRTKNGIIQNLFNAKDNSDLSLQSAGDNSYYTRSGGGGTFGMSSRITFNGQEKRGVVKRLKSISNDEFQCFVRDNLLSITSYKIILQGQVVDNS